MGDQVGGGNLNVHLSLVLIPHRRSRWSVVSVLVFVREFLLRAWRALVLITRAPMWVHWKMWLSVLLSWEHLGHFFGLCGGLHFHMLCIVGSHLWMNFAMVLCLAKEREARAPVQAIQPAAVSHVCGPHALRLVM